MAQQLSAKQYIQTRARTLPIYKCLVVKAWDVAKMAQVVVMRKHVNGNVTAGVYLVDLLCLGIKDTVYFFNLPEAEMEEKFGGHLYRDFEEIDYNLAHNIIYAGHDFALEFDIKPHADFAISKFILEEDNDAIELIDIEVGHNGKPFLMVSQAGQYSDALAKLKKIAGEGNYYYTIGEVFNEEDEEDFDDEFGGEDEYDDEEDNEEDDEMADDDNAYYNIEEFDPGEITAQQAVFIYLEDLMDDELVSTREPHEVLNMQTELALRMLKEIHPEHFDNESIYDGADGGLFENEGYASGLSAEDEETAAQAQGKILEFYQQEADNEDNPDFDTKRNAFLTGLLHGYAGNPVVVANIFEYALFVQEQPVVDAAAGYLRQLSEQYPLAVLALAFAALIKGEDAPQYAFIYNSENLAAAFPGKTDLSDADLNTYGLIQATKNLRDGNLQLAVYYYYYAAHTEVFSWLLPVVQTKFTDVINELVKAYESLTGEDEEYDEEDDDDDNGDDNPPVLRAV